MTEDRYPTCDAPREDDSGGVFLTDGESCPKVRLLLSEKEMDAAVEEMARKLLSECGNENGLVLVGVKTRGVPLAEWLGRKVFEVSGKKLAVGSLDINLYRDDLSEIDENPVVRRTELPFAIAGKGVILADDVLYTGRTIRAALDALVDFGRPKFIKLAVMVDRGFRELPIQADYIGKAVKTTAEQNVKVRFESTDGSNEVLIKG